MNKIILFLTAWLSRAGDTSFWSWVITLMYLITITVSLFYIKKIKQQKTRRFLWIWITIFLTALGINKQLDFQTLMIMTGRFAAGHLDLLQYRHDIQKIAAGVIFGTAIVIGLGVLFRARSILKESLAALSGVFVLALFAFVRMGSMTHLGKGVSFITQRVSRIHGLELLGLVIILAALLTGFYKLKEN